jgi:hypothetical protein
MTEAMPDSVVRYRGGLRVRLYPAASASSAEPCRARPVLAQRVRGAEATAAFVLLSPTSDARCALEGRLVRRTRRPGSRLWPPPSPDRRPTCRRHGSPSGAIRLATTRPRSRCCRMRPPGRRSLRRCRSAPPCPRRSLRARLKLSNSARARRHRRRVPRALELAPARRTPRWRPTSPRRSVVEAGLVLLHLRPPRHHRLLELPPRRRATGLTGCRPCRRGCIEFTRDAWTWPASWAKPKRLSLPPSVAPLTTGRAAVHAIRPPRHATAAGWTCPPIRCEQILKLEP